MQATSLVKPISLAAEVEKNRSEKVNRLICMEATADIFCKVARQEFNFLVTDYGFSPKDFSDSQMSSVDFDSPKVAVRTAWDFRDGIYFGLVAKADTFWIRASDSHSFSLSSLLELVAPDAPDEKPDIGSAHRKEENLRPWLTYYARQLQIHGARILKGDLSLLEDIKITQYCKSAKSISWEEYARIFREECAGLTTDDQKLLEAALADRSRLAVWYLLQNFRYKVLTPRFLTASHEFWMQHMQFA